MRPPENINASEEKDKMEKNRYCTKCKHVFKVNDLAPDSFRCPYCGHVITPFEDNTFQTFGLLGTKKGCGCLIVAIIVLFILFVILGGKSDGSASKGHKQTENVSAAPANGSRDGAR